MVFCLFQSIFSQYIVECSPQNIEVAKAVEVNILEHLSPPYEDLFDRAEENALKILFEAFQLYLNQDMRNYCKVWEIFQLPLSEFIIMLHTR